MESAASSRPDLAAVLFRLVGVSIPINYAEEEEAQCLYVKLQNDYERLSRVTSLCDTPKILQQLYIVATVRNWLGGNGELTAKYTQQYLGTSGWDRLSYGTTIQDGATISWWAKSHAGVYTILAQAWESPGKHEATLTNFVKAHRLEPYDATYTVKMTGMIEYMHSRKETL